MKRNTIERADREFLRRLQRLQPATIHDLCVDQNVTPTAVRQRLQRLYALDLVDRELVRSGRGRPHHAYNLTDDGRSELGDNYDELAIVLWSELQGIEEPAVKARVRSRVQRALVERYGRDVDAETLEERIEQLRDALQSRGFDVEIGHAAGQDDGETPDTEEAAIGRLLPILREYSCPYHELSSKDSSICEMEQEVFREVLGSDVELTQCCHDGHGCCEFQPVATG